MSMNNAGVMLRRVTSALNNRLQVICSAQQRFFSNQPYEEDEDGIISGVIEETRQQRRLRVGVIGMPNVGKSTLINSLTGVHLLPVSKKIDTTRSNTIAVYTKGQVQIEFEDSPGIHNRLKTKRHKKMFSPANLPHDCMKSADMCMVVVDLSSKKTSRGQLQPEVLLHLTTNRNIPSILVLNKIDQLTVPENSFHIIDKLTSGYLKGRPNPRSPAKLEAIKLPTFETKIIEAEGSWSKIDSLDEVDFAKKEQAILNQLRFIDGWPHFSDVFVVSAKDKTNVDLLREYLMNKATPGEWLHDDETITTADSNEILIDAMRASMLDNLRDEVPYDTKVVISDLHEAEDEIVIIYQLLYKRRRHETFLRNAKNLLCFSAHRKLQSIFNKPVTVDIIIV